MQALPYTWHPSPLDPIAKVQPRPACDTVRITAATGPQLPWDCSLCPCAFATRKDLAVHEARKHGKRAQHVLCAVGSRCEVCSTEFWSQARLSEHLRKQLGASRCTLKETSVIPRRQLKKGFTLGNQAFGPMVHSRGGPHYNTAARGSLRSLQAFSCLRAFFRCFPLRCASKCAFTAARRISLALHAQSAR